MKKIYTLFMLSFWAVSSSLSFADERHDAIINKYAETHSCAQETFYTLNEIVNIDDNLNNTCLVLTGQELIAQNNHLNDLLQRFPDIHVVLDVQKGDGLVNKDLLFLDNVLAQYIRRLTIINLCQDVAAIGDNFLFQCVELTQLDLSSLSRVTEIGDHFLSQCTRLTQLDLCCQVIYTGDFFLNGCKGLTQLNLSSLSRVRWIGKFFLNGCKELTQLDLLSLSQVRRIRQFFLNGCKELTQLDLSSLSQVRRIGKFFLNGCKELTQLDQIKLPAYNVILAGALMHKFPKDTEMGRILQESYIVGYIPVANVKSARK